MKKKERKQKVVVEEFEPSPRPEAPNHTELADMPPIRYYVLCDDEASGDSHLNNPKKLNVEAGPFNSVEDACHWITNSSVDAFDDNHIEKVGRDEEWGSHYMIVKAIARIKPMPTVSVSWKLEVEKL